MREEQVSTRQIIEDMPNIYFNQALDLVHRRDLPAARDKLVTVLALSPDMVDAHVVLGKVYAQMGDYQEAIARWQEALKLSPGHQAAAAGIAKARAMQVNLQQAQRRTQIAVIALGVALFAAGILVLPAYRAAVPASPTPLPTQTMVPPTATLAPTPTALPSPTAAPSPTQAPVIPTATPAPTPSVEQMSAALRANPALQGTQLALSMAGGSIKVTGSVDTEAQRQLAQVITEGKAGDKAVDVSGIVVKHPQPAAESLKALLSSLADETLGSITVDQQADALYLSGTIRSESCRQWVQGLATSLAGVGTVDTGKLAIVGIQAYRVRPGETLWGLAERYYGDGRTWATTILTANPHLPADPQAVPAGVTVRIPPPLLETGPWACQAKAQK
jgi:nucleoid-associated protein YgaU